jgi:hypothetical protein
LTVRLKRVGEQVEAAVEDLLTSDISCNGVYFFAGRGIEPGTPVDLEVVIVEHPDGPNARLETTARVVRMEPVEPAGWNGIAATFEDVQLEGDLVPLRPGT